MASKTIVFVHSLPPAEQRAAYDTFVVPESRQVAQGTLASIARIDFNKRHAPLLLIAGSDDQIIPAALNRSNYRRYAASGSVTDFKEFPGRTHFIIGQKNWPEVADTISAWLDKLEKTVLPPIHPATKSSRKDLRCFSPLCLCDLVVIFPLS